jgi:hypothetical protein
MLVIGMKELVNLLIGKSHHTCANLVLTSSALDDIKASISELKFYRDNIFPPLEPPRSKEEPSEESEGVRKTAI